jgi:hypothetical protein
MEEYVYIEASAIKENGGFNKRQVGNVMQESSEMPIYIRSMVVREKRKKKEENFFETILFIYMS